MLATQSGVLWCGKHWSTDDIKEAVKKVLDWDGFCCVLLLVPPVYFLNKLLKPWFYQAVITFVLGSVHFAVCCSFNSLNFLYRTRLYPQMSQSTSDNQSSLAIVGWGLPTQPLKKQQHENIKRKKKKTGWHSFAAHAKEYYNYLPSLCP